MTAILEPPTTAPVEPAVPPKPAPVDPAIVPVRPAPVATRSQPPRAPRTRPVLTPTGIRVLGGVLVALSVFGDLLAPTADGPRPELSGWVQLLAIGYVTVLMAALAGFALGRRWALGPALAFGALYALDVALCPATGHHQIGAWWYGQVAVGAVLLLLPVAALAGTRGQDGGSSAS
jgi:hypothetical protein